MQLLNMRVLAAALTATPALLMAFSSGPPPLRTGVPVDGGLTCTACHRTYAPVNSDVRGRVMVTVAEYTPGQKQNIKVRVEHPEAIRWGFQLTARLESDQSKQAGTFTPVDNSIRVQCAPSGNAPCNGALEFASHVAASTQVNQRDFGEWTVEWTAPATNVGPIVFYVAGNAADNSGNPTGDRIYNNNYRIMPAGSSVRPVISAGGVGDAFTFQPGAASSTWLAIFGQNLTRTTRDWTFALADATKLPTTLAGVSVTVGGKAASVYYLSPGQINVLAALDDAVGDVPVVVTTPDGASNTLTVKKQAFLPALYAPFVDGGKQFVTAIAIDGSVVGKVGLDPRVTRAVKPGEVVALFGSGFGPTTPAVPTDQVVSTPATVMTLPTIRFGQTQLTVMSGSLVQAGVYQFNVQVPDTTPEGDLQVAITAGGVASSTNVYISVKR